MAKKNPENIEAPKVSDEWETRDDVERLMRADEVCADKGRYKRAVGRLGGTLKRLTKKSGRSAGRSGGR